MPDPSARPHTVGRLKHFATVTSPLTLLASNADLAKAQQLVLEYKSGVGEGRKAWGREDAAGIWKAKQRECTFAGWAGSHWVMADFRGRWRSVRFVLAPWSVHSL